MAEKTFNNLPVVLQTTAIKNFFDNTVDQLYSKANTEILKGYIGTQSGDEINLSGAFITSGDADRTAYALSPAVNNINPVTGESENIIFYDELCNTLRAYGVNTRNHNSIFASNFNTFLPPINIDKFLNYAEYYWAIPGAIESLVDYTFTTDASRASGLSRSQTYSITNPTTSGTGLGCKISVFVDDSDGSGYVQIISKGNNYDANDTITITDSQIGGFGGADLTFTIKEVLGPTAITITPTSQEPLNLDKDVKGLKEFTPTGGKKFRNGMIVKFTGDYVTPATETNKEFVVSGVGTEIRLTVKNTTSGADQDKKDYIVIERGSTTGSDWSSVNHWYHIENFKEVGDKLPAKKYRANRPIVEFNSDLELYYDNVTVQSKETLNQAPLFNLYDDKGNSLSDSGLYAQSNFSGSKIFNYRVGKGTKDPELGFPLSFTQTKSASEIAFENFISTERFNYTPFGSEISYNILGTYYYKITGETPQYYSSWRASPKTSEQKILTSYKITSNDVLEKNVVFDIGAVPNVNSGTPSGYAILVRHNGIIVSNYEYVDASIKFNSFNFQTGDILEIEVASDDGLRLINNSRYDLPLSWAHNPENNEVEVIAEPQYLPHFKRLIENQNGFSGDALGRNNFDNSEKDISHALNIVQTDEDLMLGAFLVDDQPHNLIEAFRFVAKEYQKYKNRLIKEINSYYKQFDVDGLSNEFVLEKVLRNIQSFNIGKNVFGTTYILPYGDTYTEESFDVTDITEFEYTLSNWADITKLENTVLVYFIEQGGTLPRLLELDVDYTFSSTNPITVQLDTNKFNLNVGDTLVTKLYNSERDSANCPPTPSSMGLYPLHQPRIEVDNTFTTPVNVIIGHDGSKTVCKDTIEDTILLEFEQRIYNSCQKQFRDANSLPLFNVLNVRPGAFRDTGFELKEFNDLLRNSFTNWAARNKVDALTNEFYDETDNWTWNYRGNTDVPGYWRGWYNYYYDTVRPHTHPWEMLGFFEKPTWWNSQYGTDFSSNNTSMWQDLEEGIIRQGPRENIGFTGKNIFARPNLVNGLLPVDKYGNLRAPAEIASTGATSIDTIWNNRREHNLVITDQFYDSNGSNNLPNGVNATAGTGISFRIAFDADGWDLYSKGFDSFLTSNVYITNSNIEKSFQLTNYSFDQLGNSQIIFDQSVTSASGDYTLLGNTFVGISVTGTPITNPKSENSFNSEGEWFENKYYRNERDEIGTYFIEPEHAGLSEWSTTEHSPIVGWSFDNIPIYGPYGYSDPMDSTSAIINIKSSYEFKAGTRPSGPGGAYTGEYVEDYTWNSALGSQNEYADKFNMRYGVTPESPITPIYYYVTTINDSGRPMFPFVFGGVKNVVSDVTWAGKYYSAVTEAEKNNLGTITETGQISVLASIGTVIDNSASGINLTGNDWRFGDGAPVENAWKYSSDYPFAVVEGLMLSKPGKFATVFADPTNVESPKFETYKVINKTDRTNWNFKDKNHFRIHGEYDESGNIITNSGYTQFIHSWLTFQGLNTTTDFAEKLRKVNVKLAHRLEGFSDKDTMILRSDQFSSTGTSQSLVIPDENYELVVHSSPYKERNFYSGVMIQKVANGYKVRGYDKNLGYFNTLKLNKFGGTSEFEVGGEAVEYTIWEPNVAYQKGTIVSYQNRYYRAEEFVTSSQTFIASLWKSLSSLPQRGAVKGVVYQDTLPEVVRVDYETKFATHQDVLDFLISLGKYQEMQGYDFGGFDTAINDARNWTYAGQQFLFWVAGGWENNNTLELSPMANKVSFELKDHFVAKINRIERNQFSILNQEGKVIQPEECEIVRSGNRIEITPPDGNQIYGLLLHTKQTEHALVIDNVTEFNDTIFDQLHSQRQTRLRIKGKKTANWNGTFSSEGFIISGDELKPNLDNMAQSLGRYHELGFIPVEKQLYEKARGLFGYEEKEYLNNLEVDDDTQFEFYSGMIHEKGTAPALSKIAKSNNIVQGEMTVYDEWAVKVGEFGDLENDQAIELKIEKSDLVSSPQMITLAFPEDTTGVIKKISVIEAKHKYHEAPTVSIAAPTLEPKVQATAVAHLNSDGNISGIQVTNVGSGYPTDNVKLNIIVSDLLVNDYSNKFNPAIVQSSDLIEITRTSATPELDFLNLTTFKIVEKQTGSDVNIDIDISDGGLTLQDIADYINANSNVSAEYIQSQNTFDSSTSNYITSGILSLTGSHFELVEHNNTLANLNLSAGTHEVKQRYSVGSVDNIKGKTTGATTIDDITVTIDGQELARTTDFIYDHGSRTAINFNINSYVIAESQRVDASGKLFLDTVFNGSVTLTNTVDIAGENLYNANGVYPYLDVYVNGTILENVPSRQIYSATATGITLLDVSLLPQGFIKNGANVYVHEHSTVELNDNVLTDVPGADLAIKVFTKDNIIALGEVERIYTITPDSKNDDVILIDIDDSNRFLKKPIGTKEKGLWPTTSNISYSGVKEDRFKDIPNAGYVSKYDVDFRSFSINDISRLYRNENFYHPDENHTIHVASAEADDWNVYKLKSIKTNDANAISYVETGMNTLNLLSDVDLFKYTDSNKILETDTGRFLDYHLAIKDTNQNEKFVVWANQEQLDFQQVLLSNLREVKPLEVGVASIKPAIKSTYEISNVEPSVGHWSSCEIFALGNGVIKVNTPISSGMTIGDQVILVSMFAGVGSGTVADGNFANSSSANIVTVGANVNNWSGNVFTVGYVGTDGFTVNFNTVDYSNFVRSTYGGKNQRGYLDETEATVMYLNKTTITTTTDHNIASGREIRVDLPGYDGDYIVKGSSNNTIVIDARFVQNGPTSGGNVLTKDLTITTTDNHGLGSYTGKIAISNHHVKYYNKTYDVRRAFGNIIQVSDTFPVNALTYLDPLGNAVLSTVDHDMIYPNGNKIKLDNIQSADGIVEAFNRRQAIMRGSLTYRGSLGLGFNMLRKGGRGTGTIGGMPYISDFKGISIDNVSLAGAITVPKKIATKKGFVADGTIRADNNITKKRDSALRSRKDTQNIPVSENVATELRLPNVFDPYKVGAVADRFSAGRRGKFATEPRDVSQRAGIRGAGGRAGDLISTIDRFSRSDNDGIVIPVVTCRTRLDSSFKDAGIQPEGSNNNKSLPIPWEAGKKYTPHPETGEQGTWMFMFGSAVSGWICVSNCAGNKNAETAEINAGLSFGPAPPYRGTSDNPATNGTGLGYSPGGANGSQNPSTPVVDPSILDGLESGCEFNVTTNYPNLPTPPPSNPGPTDPEPPIDPGVDCKITLSPKSVEEGAPITAYLQIDPGVSDGSDVFVTLEKNSNPTNGYYHPADSRDIELDIKEIIDESTGTVLRTEGQLTGTSINSSSVSTNSPLRLTVQNGSAGPIRIVTKADEFTEGGDERIVGRLYMQAPPGGAGEMNPSSLNYYCGFDSAMIKDTSTTPKVDDPDPDPAGTATYSITPKNQSQVQGSGYITFSVVVNNITDASETYELRFSHRQATITQINKLGNASTDHSLDNNNTNIPIGQHRVTLVRITGAGTHGQIGETLAEATFSITAVANRTAPDPLANESRQEATVCETTDKFKRFWQTQSTNSQNTGQSDNTDYWSYDLSDKGGTGVLVYNNFSEADQIRIYQADSVRSINKGNLIGKIALSVKASNTEKNVLQKAPTGNRLQDFVLTTGSTGGKNFNDDVDPSDNTGAKHCGKIVFTVKGPCEGGNKKIIVVVNKPSSVYSYYIDVPHTAGGLIDDLNKNYGNSGMPSNLQTGPGGVSVNGGVEPDSQTAYYQAVGSYKGAGGLRWYDALQTQHNFSGFNAYSMTGHRSLPSILRSPAKKSTNVINYGKYEDVTQEKYVTVTEQRISGGTVIPLATPIPRPVRLKPRPIRGADTRTSILQEFFNNVIEIQGIAEIPAPDPVRIPDNAWTEGAGEPVQASESYDGEYILIDEAIFEPEFQLPPSYPGVSVEDPNAPANVEVDYTTQPIITILPKKEVRPGVLLPDGLVAYVPLYRPTPTVKISADDIIGVEPGDELIINGTPVTVPGGGYSGFLNAMQCANVPGVNVSGKVAGSGIPYVKVSSCTNAPLTFNNGCASGGKYKEIMDFHVVRTFIDNLDYSETTSTSQVPSTSGRSTSQQKVQNAANPAFDDREQVDNPDYDPNANYTDPTLPNPDYDASDPASSPTIDNPEYTADPPPAQIDNEDYDPNGFINPDGAKTNAGFSTVTVTSTVTNPGYNQTTRSTLIGDNTITGGSGYAVGDRLRLIGGTPVPTPYGGIYEICVKNGGANYSSPANVRIYIGDGTTPGSGAKIDTVILDDITGGIQKVYLKSAGVGYDIKNPPKVTVVDTYASPTAGVPRVTPATLTAQVDKSSYHVPRVAKFMVTAIDERGAIHGLKIIDRGVYEQLPSDLDRGLPLEYDYVLLGDEDDGEWLRNVDADGDGQVREQPTGTGLGQWDPLNNFARLPDPIGPGGDGYNPNPPVTIGINEISPAHGGRSTTQKIDYAETYPYLTDATLNYPSYVYNAGNHRRNLVQTNLDSRDSEQIANGGKTYWGTFFTVNEPGRLWQFEQGKVTTVSWTTPKVTPSASYSRAEMNKSLSHLYISSNGQVEPVSDGKFIVVWLSEQPGGTAIGGPGDYKLLYGPRVKGRSNHVYFSHDPRFFDGSNEEWQKQTNPTNDTGPDILNGGSNYGLKFLNMCVIDETFFKGYDSTLGTIINGNDGYELLAPPGTQAFLNAVQNETAYWKTFSSYNGGLTITLKVPEGFTQSYVTGGYQPPLTIGTGSSVISTEGFASNANMLPFIGERWDGVMPDHCRWAPHGGGWWNDRYDQREFYPVDIGPAGPRHIQGNARRWPVPTDGKVWVWPISVTVDKFWVIKNWSRSFSPAGGYIDSALADLDLVICRWFSDVPGGAPRTDVLGVPQVYIGNTPMAEGGPRTNWAIDANEEHISQFGGDVIFPIMNKTWYLNECLVSYSTASNIFTRWGNDSRTDARAPYPEECVAWDFKASGVANPWPWMVSVCFGTTPTSQERYVKRLAYENADSPDYQPPEGQWEARLPVLQDDIEYVPVNNSVQGSTPYSQTAEIDWDGIANMVDYESNYPLLRQYYVPTNTNKSTPSYGLGPNGLGLSAYPALTSTYGKNVNDYSAMDPSYYALIDVRHSTDPYEKLDDIKEFGDISINSTMAPSVGSGFVTNYGEFTIGSRQVVSIPFTTPDIITPTGFDPSSPWDIGMAVEFGSNTFYAIDDDSDISSGSFGTPWVMVWWSEFAGGPALGEVEVLPSIKGNGAGVGATFSQEVWNVKDTVRGTQHGGDLKGLLNTSYGVHYLNIAPVMATTSDDITSGAINDPNYIGSSGMLSRLSTQGISTDLYAVWRVPMVRQGYDGAKEPGTTVPVNYLVRSGPTSDGSEGLGIDALIGGGYLMFDSTGQGNYGEGLTFPSAKITSMPFTRPTVSPKIDPAENMLPKGQGVLNGSGFTGDPDTANGGVTPKGMITGIEVINEGPPSDFVPNFDMENGFTGTPIPINTNSNSENPGDWNWYYDKLPDVFTSSNAQALQQQAFEWSGSTSGSGMDISLDVWWWGGQVPGGQNIVCGPTSTQSSGFHNWTLYDVKLKNGGEGYNVGDILEYTPVNNEVPCADGISKPLRIKVTEVDNGSGSNYYGGEYAYHGKLELNSNMYLTDMDNYTGFGTVWLVIWASDLPGGPALSDNIYFNEWGRASGRGLTERLSGDPHIFNGAYVNASKAEGYTGPSISEDIAKQFLNVGSNHGVAYLNFALVNPALFFYAGYDTSSPELSGTAWHLPGTLSFDNAIHPIHGWTVKNMRFQMFYPPSYNIQSGGGMLTGGGSGARLYFTSRNIPDCSEKGGAKEALGLPDIVRDPDYVTEIADMFNDGLVDAGYDPEDVSFGSEVVNNDISVLALDAPGYDGVEFGELTPGFLDKLGIPIGDYNHAMACMIMNNTTSVSDENLTVDQINNLTTEEGFVIPTSVALPEEILSITCVIDLEQPGRTIFGNAVPGEPGFTDADFGGELGHLGNVTASFIDNLYQYELVSPTGGTITNTQEVQNCDVLYFESQRYSSIEDLQTASDVKTLANVSTDITSYNKVWIDGTSNVNMNLTNPSQGSKTDFVEDSWTYYENGIAKRWSQPLVDPTYVRNIMLYDSVTGEREHDLDVWDPFKGVLPAFIDAEIHFVSKEDPVVYNSKRAKFGADQCGQVWWDTSGVRYNWYEQGSNKERATNWGSVFPGSVINLFEWTESLTPPTQYTGTGTPKNASQYLTDRRKDPISGEYTNYYYFWVHNKENLSTHAKMRHMRKFATIDLARYLANPVGQGLNTISFLSSNDQSKANQSSMLISNLENIIREDEQILQINLSRNLNPLGLKHVAWKLLRENDIDSEIPEDLSAKLIDSLAGQDSTGQVVPATNLSEVEKYGTSFRPRQTMFKDLSEARREMHYAINEILADIKIETLKPKWAQGLTAQNLVQTSTWYEVERTSSTNQKIRYDFSYKALFTVSSVKELDTLKQSKLSDGTIVMVRNSKKDRYQLWRWHGKDAEFKLIAIENETAQISDAVFKQELSYANKVELREFLYLCKDRIFEGTNLWNKFFFAMLKFAYGEQLQLDWAFKSSYIYVDKEESDLTKRVGFKPDNFDSVKEYMDEAKPYSAKIREYKDGKKTPIDYISDQMISDFDIPPYPDPVQGKVRVLSISSTDDTNILTENGDYVKWYSEVQDHGGIANAIVNTSPVRTGNVKMVFDRTDWRLLPYNFDANAQNYAQGTAEMISYLNTASNNDVSANSNVSMSGRIFKFNPEVRAQFAEDITNSDVTDITNKDQIENAFVSGALVKTLALVKDKVGGGFRGDELDANVFTKVVSGEDPLDLVSGFGFDTDPFDAVGFDAKIEVQNFEGVLNGNTTFRRDGITYEGFDSVTFQKVLYGEERPEEMAMFSPLENMIINVRTSVFAYGNGPTEQPTDAVALGPYSTTVETSVGNNTVITTAYGSLLENNDSITFAGGSNAISQTFTISNVSQNYNGNVYSNTTFSINLSGYTQDPNANITFTRGGDAVDVEYQVHYDMFGGEEWLRKLTDGSTSTTLAEEFKIWDDSFTVDDPDKIQEPKPGVPGILWINNCERIEYRSLDKTRGVVSDITRGTRGTTISGYSAGVRINTGNYTEIFDDSRNTEFQKRNPDSAYWLRDDGTTLSLTDITNRATGNVQIAKYLQGDETPSIGWDARGWEVGAWDGG